MAVKFKASAGKREPVPVTLELKTVGTYTILQVYSTDGFGRVSLLWISKKDRLRKLAHAILAEVGE